MPMTLLSRRATIAMLGLAGLPAAAAAQTATEAPPAAPAAGDTRGRPVGRVRIEQTQAAFIGSVSWGRGTLTFRGRNTRFRIRGLGAGGIGLATMTAVGDVYNLTRLSDFAGAYAQARAGAVLGDQQIRGGLWLINPNGVQINLRPQRRGVALQLGGDALHIELTR